MAIEQNNLKFNEAVEVENKEQHQWFLDALKGIEKAEEAMKQSVKNNPNPSDLVVLERAKGIIEEMQKATLHEAAMRHAKKIGND